VLAAVVLALAEANVGARASTAKPFNLLKNIKDAENHAVDWGWLRVVFREIVQCFITKHLLPRFIIRPTSGITAAITLTAMS